MLGFWPCDRCKKVGAVNVKKTSILIKRIFIYFGGGFILWFLFHTIFITFDGFFDETVRSDVGIILGNKVKADGTLSERLAKRVDKGIELYQDSLIGLVIVSGGLGIEGYYEGTKMSEYMIERGIPPEKIIIDNLGITTSATAENVKKLGLDDASSVTVITQFYHISRTKLAFKKQGFSKVYGVHAEYFELRDFYSLFREFFAYYKYWWF